MPITSGYFDTGSKSGIGTTAVRVSQSLAVFVFGVLVKADDDNSGDVYIGWKGVTAGTDATHDGVGLTPGDAIFIEVDKATKIYAIGSEAGQKVWWTAV